MKVWKFVSSNTNYRIVLKNGIPAEPLTGRNATPGIYAKFEDGELVVKDEELANMLINREEFGSDFILSEDEGKTDMPFKRHRSSEPEHDMIELKHGSIGKNLNPKSPVKLTPETMKALEKMASDMAQAKFKELVDTFMTSKQETSDVGETGGAEQEASDDSTEDASSEDLASESVAETVTETVKKATAKKMPTAKKTTTRKTSKTKSSK